MGAEGMISFIAVAVILFPLAAAMVSDSNLGKMMNEETVNYSSLQKEIEPLPYVVSKADTGGGGINTTTIIIVVVSTATLTFLLATLIFCWYTRTYGGVQNDEKQILSLSSSQKPAYNLQKSVKDSSKTSDQLLSTGSGVLRKDSSVNSSVSLGIPVDPPPGNLSAAGIPPLKPPPGRPELALKTPPGRKDLSVQCPPVNTNSPPNRSPVGAAPPVRAPSARRSPSARRPPSAAPAPPPPPPLSGTKPPPPPPPLKKGPAPPPPPVGSRPPPRPGLKLPRPSSEPGDPDGDDSNKAKLKPFFWDKVMANPDQAMVWHQIRAGSFQFNEEMIENLFGYNTTDKSKSNNKKSSSSQDPSSNFVQIMDPKKAQNLSIILKALNVTTNEVCDALKEGNELPVELIQTLLKVAPTGEEELKLRLYNGDVSRLGTAERFLKRLVEIPFAFKRLESLLFMCTLQEEQEIIKESFQTLEAACKELRKSRLFLKLLEAVLKTGNRMNDGTFRGSAQAFKLDTLLKLSDVKGVDGKTTLLHFVVLEIIRAEGIRAAKTAQPTETFSTFGSDKLVEESANNSQDSDEYYRNLGLQVVSSLSNELSHVTKAAILDADGLTGMVSKFGHALLKAREFLNTDLKNIKEEKHEGDDEHDDEEEDEFAVILANFVRDADKDVMWMLEEEKRIMALVKNTADYFHGQAGKDEGLRLFVIVRDFLIILDKVCKEIKSNPLKKPSKMTEKRDVQSSETKDVSEPKMTRTRTKDDTDDAQHETRENGDLERVKHDESSCKMQENDGLEHRKHEGEDGDSKQDELSCKMQKKDDLEHETHEDNDIQLKTTEDDDGSRPESQKKDDDSKHETHEDNDIQLKTAEDDDGSRPESRKKDDDSKHKRPEDNDIQLKTAEDDDGSRPESRKKDDEEMHKHQFRVPHERLLPAIALRRVDTFSSNSSSDED